MWSFVQKPSHALTGCICGINIRVLVVKIRIGEKVCVVGDLLLEIFSFLFLQEEPREVASIGEQSKGRSDKHKFGKNPFSEQERRQVKKKKGRKTFYYH